MKTFVLKTSIISHSRKVGFILLGVVLTMAGMAQTYTSRADGDWSNPATWAGGVAPGTTIAAGSTVVIKNNITFDLVNSDLVISGTLNIMNDTLTFASAFAKDIKVNGGLLILNNGTIVQNISAHKNNLAVDGGRVSLTNSVINVSKDFTSINGGSRSYVNSKIYVGQKYEIGGTSTASSTDTIRNSLIETGMAQGGDFTINNNGILRVANAVIKTDNSSSFKNTNGGTISVISQFANSNYGFDYLKISKDLQNDGTWNARIDAACIGGTISGAKMADIDFTRSQDCSATPLIGNAPELTFINPVLKSGTANKQGAVYRFANVISGVDAEITLKKFSRSDIQMDFIDRSDVGWNKAFQPNFGLPGLVKPNQNWYVDFQLKFYKAGTSTSIVVPKVDMTALDVDGDGVSVKEYAVFQNPANVIYSTSNYLTNQSTNNLGQKLTCPVCGVASVLIACPVCGGDGRTGMWNLTDCSACNATGLVYTACNHAFDGINGNLLEGPVTNFADIDTAATQVMTTYQYTEVSTIDFRYGAQSGSSSANGSGIRLNSLWFRQFTMAPASILPVKLNNFSAYLNNKSVNLTWTANEENVSHYVIQRSTDGANYSDVATVFATNAAVASTYQYKDANVSSSTNTVYYRLLMVDQGKTEGVYSLTRVIRLGREEESLKLVTYPNPVTEQVKVTLPSSWQGKPALLQLYNANGIILQSMQLGSASQTESMQLSKLTNGFYLIKAMCNGEVAQQRIIKN